MLGDPAFQEDPEVFNELVKNLTSYSYATSFMEKITQDTHNFSFYDPVFDLVEDSGTAHLNVIDEKSGTVFLLSFLRPISSHFEPKFRTSETREWLLRRHRQLTHGLVVRCSASEREYFLIMKWMIFQLLA